MYPVNKIIPFIVTVTVTFIFQLYFWDTRKEADELTYLMTQAEKTLNTHTHYGT